MNKRLFIAINLPGGLKEQIYQELDAIRANWPDKYPIRFTPIDNLHITVKFLGYQSENNLPLIEDAVGKTALAHLPPKIRLDNFVYGPDENAARMIWLEGESNSLALIQKDLEKDLAANQISFDRETRPFRLHLTLARFRFAPRPLPPLRRKILLSFSPLSLDLMESRLNPAGPVYSILKQLNFNTD